MLWLALGLSLLACGEVKVVVPEGAYDTTGTDADATSGSDAVTPVDAGPTDTGGADVAMDAGTDAAVDSAQPDVASPKDSGPVDIGPPPEFTGKGTVTFVPKKGGPAGNLLIVRVMVQAALQAEPGTAMVLWMKGAKGLIRNHGVMPPAIDFTYLAPPPPIGAGDPIDDYNAALVSWEPVAGAAKLKKPGPVVIWQGGVPDGVWVHVRHVLSESDEGEGYAEQAQMIAAELAKQAKIATTLANKGQKKKAKATAEIIHNLVAGPGDLYDLDKDGVLVKEVVDVQVGLVGAKGAGARAVDHAGYASSAEPGLKYLAEGVQAMKVCAVPLENKGELVTGLAAAYATGAQPSVAPLVKAVGQLIEQVDCLAKAAGKMAVIPLELPPGD